MESPRAMWASSCRNTMRRCSSGQSSASSGRRMTGERHPHVSGVLTTELEKSWTSLATPALLRSCSRSLLQTESSRRHDVAAIRPSLTRPIASHKMMPRNPIAQSNGSIGNSPRFPRARDEGRAAAEDCGSANEASWSVTRAVTDVALLSRERAEDEDDSKGTFHLG